MNVPDYIKTEWRGRGHAFIKLSDSECRSCLKVWDSKIETENATKYKTEDVKSKNSNGTEEAKSKNSDETGQAKSKNSDETGQAKSKYSDETGQAKSKNSDEAGQAKSKNSDEAGQAKSKNSDETGQAKSKNSDETGQAKSKNSDETGQAKSKNSDETGRAKSKNSNETSNEDLPWDVCIHSKTILCSLSTLNIWEYEEYKEDYDEEYDEQNLQDVEEEDSLPPVTSETWKEWTEFWEYWKDIYVDLGWVHRYPEFCKEETKKWYDVSCEENEKLVQELQYCDKLELMQEKLVSKFNPKSGEEYEKMLDKLYGEHSTKRYWAHFRLFLRDNDVEISKKLADFLAWHGIIDEPLPRVADAEHFQNVGVNENGDENLNAQLVNDLGKQKNDLNAPHQESEISDEQDRENLSKSDSGVVTPTSDDCSRASPSKESITNHETDKPTNIDPMTIGLEITSDVDGQLGDESVITEIVESIKEKVTLHEEYLVSEENLIATEHTKSSVADTGAEKSPGSPEEKKTSHRRTRGSLKKRSAYSGGAAWALQHAKQLDESQSGSETSANGNNTAFVFGSAANAPNESVKYTHTSTSKQPKDSTRTQSKRKYESMEENISPDDEKNPDDADQSSAADEVLSRLLMRNIRTALDVVAVAISSFWQLGKLYSKGLLNFICFILRINPLGPDHPLFMSFSPYWWFGYSFMEETTFERLMRKSERVAINTLWKLFRPTIRHITFYPPLLSIESLHLTTVEKCEEKRSILHSLLKITQNTNLETQDIKGLSLLNMTEEDLDYELEQEEEEFSHVSSDDQPTHRTSTSHDQEGEAQELVRVPADEGKMRILSEDDFKTSQAEECPKKSKLTAKYDEVSENWCFTKIKYDADGNFTDIPYVQKPKLSLQKKIQNVLRNSSLVRFSMLDEDKPQPPKDLDRSLVKYWLQRYRFFLRYDEGIKLDNESWYSVTPEMIAVHQANRCRCNIVIDAFCGAGGNAIQLATTCNRVIAIDIDPGKIELARHNAKIYGVEDRIEFIVGDFFKLAPTLKANVVFLSPPWGGINYKQDEFYNVFTLGDEIDGKKLYEVAIKITPNVAMYLPKTSNVLQIIELAGCGGKVDIEYDHISNKRKSLTAYYGALANFPFEGK